MFFPRKMAKESKLLTEMLLAASKKSNKFLTIWVCSNHMQQYSPFNICYACMLKKNCSGFYCKPYKDTREFPVLLYTLLVYCCIIYDFGDI